MARGEASSSKGSQSSQTGLGTLSLAPIIAGQLFGAQTGSAPGGGLTLTGTGGVNFPQIFSPTQFGELRDLARPFESFLPGDTTTTVGGQAGDVLTSVLPGVEELIQTGFGDEIANLSQFLFETDIAPQLREQFGAQLGLGVNDSDLRATLAREGQRASLEAANAAVQNRILGLQLGSQLPGAVAEQAGTVESLLQQATRQGEPAGQLLDLLLTLGGLDTQAGGVGTAAGKQESKSAGGGILWA